MCSLSRDSIMWPVRHNTIHATLYEVLLILYAVHETFKNRRRAWDIIRSVLWALYELLETLYVVGITLDAVPSALYAGLYHYTQCCIYLLWFQHHTRCLRHYTRCSDELFVVCCRGQYFCLTRHSHFSELTQIFSEPDGIFVFYQGKLLLLDVYWNCV